MLKMKLNNEMAIEIIHRERIKNSFTMGLSLDEFVDGFRQRYFKMYKVELPKDYIAIAEKIIEFNKNDDQEKQLKHIK